MFQSPGVVGGEEGTSPPAVRRQRATLRSQGDVRLRPAPRLRSDLRPRPLRPHGRGLALGGQRELPRSPEDVRGHVRRAALRPADGGGARRGVRRSRQEVRTLGPGVRSASQIVDRSPRTYRSFFFLPGWTACALLPWLLPLTCTPTIHRCTTASSRSLLPVGCGLPAPRTVPTSTRWRRSGSSTSPIFS